MCFNKESNEVTTLRASHKITIKENTRTLNILKNHFFSFESGKITQEEFNKPLSQIAANYKSANALKKLAKSKLEKAKTDDEFLKFDSIQFFLGELGWAVGITLFSIISLVLTFIEKNKYQFGKTVFYGTLFYIGCFYCYYTIVDKLDFPRYYYIISMFVCMFIMPYAISLIYSRYSNKIELLNIKIRNLISYINTGRENTIVELASEAITEDNKDQIMDLVEQDEENMLNVIETALKDE